jgi:putative ABC transport system permease protein
MTKHPLDDLDDDIRDHIERETEDNIARGMSPEEARRAAMRAFGNVALVREDTRAVWVPALLDQFAQDVRYGLRRMRRQPGFTALIALTLALGVGANAAMFGLVDVLMFRTPAHVPEPERIVNVSARNYVQYQELRERLQSVELTAYTRGGLSFGTGMDAEPFRTECITPSYFDVAGTMPVRGRGFTADDDRLGAPRTVILSHAFWTRRFDGDPRVLGMNVDVAGRSFEVIGVAPAAFTGLGLGAIDGWLLFTAVPEACSFSGMNLLRSSSGSWLTVVGRLRPGVTQSQAAAELAAVEGDIETRPRRRLPDGTQVHGNFSLTPVYESRRFSLSRDSRLALWLAGGAAVLFLLACANVAGLLWTHTLDRGREMAVRLQLGASRLRVFRQLLIEHLLIATLGGVAAVMVGLWISEGIRSYFPFAVDADLMSGRTLAVVAGLAFTAGLLSGAVPGIQASRAGSERFLRTGTALMGGRARFRTALLSVQVGLALVLVAAAGLFVGSVDNYRRDFDYDLDRVVVASIDFRSSSTRTPQEVYALYRVLEERIRQLPQVERTALSSAPVLGSGGSLRVFGIRRSPDDPTGEMNALNEVSPDYFATLGLTMAAGRGFTSGDPAGDAVVINEALAAKLFLGEDPIGKPLLVGSRKREVVGVSRPFRMNIQPGDQGNSQTFVPLSETADSETTPQVLLVRTHRAASSALPAIATALRGAAPDLPYVNVRTLQELADVQARSWLLGATVFGLFGTLAVILAGIGIYGALAFSIRQRTTEIGVRMALGAMRGDIARMVLGHGALVAAIGLALGLAGAFAGSRYIESLLFNVSAADVATLTAASAIVAGAALVGCLVPAFRATRVDPAVALRTE